MIAVHMKDLRLGGPRARRRRVVRRRRRHRGHRTPRTAMAPNEFTISSS